MRDSGDECWTNQQGLVLLPPFICLETHLGFVFIGQCSAQRSGRFSGQLATGTKQRCAGKQAVKRAYEEG
jgi:hypothetical protein